MKKLTILFLIAALCAVGITANGKSDTTAAAKDSGPVTVQYGFWGNPDAIGVEQEIIEAFEASNDKIKIEPVVSGYGEYHTKLLTLLAGGNAPDVMRIDSYFFQDFTQMNALRALDDLVARDGVDMKAYYQQGVIENTFKGKLYGLPWGTAAIYMLINLDVMDAAGLDLPSLDWTMDDFEQILRVFEGQDDVYGYGFELGNMSAMFPFVWANNGDLLNADKTKFAMNSPEAVAALDRIASLYQEGLMPEDCVTADPDTLTRWFINNKIAMRLGAASEILSLQKVEGSRFEAWPMPSGASQQATIFKSNIIGLNSKSKKTEDAWTFLKFLRGPQGEGESLYMKAKRIPPTIDDAKYWKLYADPNKYPKMIEENSRKIAAIYGHNLPIRPGWLEIQQLICPAYQQIFLGELSAQEAMDGIAPKAQAVLDRTAK